MQHVPMRPDYTAGICYGGELKDFPDRSVRYFNDKRRKREVRFNIMSWRGIDPRATHFYVYFIEGNDPFWDGETWRLCWHSDEAEGKGRSGRIEHKTIDGAWRTIERLKKWVFPAHKHVVEARKRKRPSKLASGD